MDLRRLTGLGVALATPFKSAEKGDFGAGAVDMKAFRALVARVVAGGPASGGRGADFLVPLGSTGEAATITDSEREEILAATLEEAKGVPVILGTGHNSTAQAASLAARAAKGGADGILVVTPYYNKPQPAGVEAHFRAVAAAAPGLPIIVYNVPGRTGLNLAPKDLARLWAIPEVVGVKESSGNLAQIGEILRTMPAGRVLLSGDDALALPAIAMGGSGLISVLGNLLPAETKALVDAALAGRRDEARALHARLLPMMDALFLETSPAPLKAALSLAGFCSGALRLPLAPASEATRARLAELLPSYGLGLRAGVQA
jgi:4-hydroxy-tetrahydrodipicolinate synthase